MTPRFLLVYVLVLTAMYLTWKVIDVTVDFGARLIRRYRVRRILRECHAEPALYDPAKPHRSVVFGSPLARGGVPETTDRVRLGGNDPDVPYNRLDQFDGSTWDPHGLGRIAEYGIGTSLIAPAVPQERVAGRWERFLDKWRVQIERPL